MERSWLSLENKTVLVTGGASGIGKAVAQEFLNVGANVVVCDLNPNMPEFEVNEGSGKMLYSNMNVTDKESIKVAVKKAKETFGSIDVLVNNAGINIPSLLIDSLLNEHTIKELDDKYLKLKSAKTFQFIDKLLDEVENSIPIVIPVNSKGIKGIEISEK